MLYLYAKAIHIIFVICWMAGLFYAVRLFVYHTEARQRVAAEYGVLHRQFTLMEKKLWWVITTPSMYLAVLAGLTMLWQAPALLATPWMQVKLGFVAVLIAYHFVCQRIMFRLEAERSRWTSGYLRLWNEVATVILFAVVFLVVLKHAFNWIYGVLGIVALAIVLMLAVRLYKRARDRSS